MVVARMKSHSKWMDCLNWQLGGIGGRIFEVHRTYRTRDVQSVISPRIATPCRLYSREGNARPLRRSVCVCVPVYCCRLNSHLGRRSNEPILCSAELFRSLWITGDSTFSIFYSIQPPPLSVLHTFKKKRSKNKSSMWITKKNLPIRTNTRNVLLFSVAACKLTYSSRPIHFSTNKFVRCLKQLFVWPWTWTHWIIKIWINKSWQQRLQCSTSVSYLGWLFHISFLSFFLSCFIVAVAATVLFWRKQQRRKIKPFSKTKQKQTSKKKNLNAMVANKEAKQLGAK